MEKEQRRKTISFAVPVNVAAEYERLAGRLRMSKSRLMSNALEAGLEDVQLLEKLGVVGAVGGVVKLKEEMEGWRDRKEGKA
jgi:hypothetical protein